MRTLRELEPPSTDEGFTAVERIGFVRAPWRRARVGVFAAASALGGRGLTGALEQADPGAPHLVFDWDPDGDAELLDTGVVALRREVRGRVEAALCPHPGGPPSCWCRPPLPGLPLAFSRAHDVDPSRSVLIGSSPAHRTLAAAVGARFIAV